VFFKAESALLSVVVQLIMFYFAFQVVLSSRVKSFSEIVFEALSQKQFKTEWLTAENFVQEKHD
jgi:hypothetical protein